MTPLVSLLAVVLAACETAGGPLPDTSGTPNDQMWSELEAMGQSVANDPAEFDALTGGQPTGELGVEWKRWLDRFGHRGTWESTFAEPRYREDPSLILSYLATRGPTPRDRPAVGGSNCLAAIPRWVGARLIMQRETLRDQSVRLWEDCRRVLIHAERRWIDQGRLPEVGSLWFCTYEEVLAMCHGKFTMDETELERRREDHERDRRCQPPLVVRSDRDPCREDLAPGSGDQLSGLVLTGGRAEGRATILRSPDEMVPADGPRIAVVPVMSAGWVPAIASAEGVVVESGGLLSHGSILLRELGRCAVTNAHGAQSLINDGDWVSIDGESGTVHVCRRVAAEPSDDRGGNGGH